MMLGFIIEQFELQILQVISDKVFMEDQASKKVTTEVRIHTLRSKMGRTEGKKMAC